MPGARNVHLLLGQDTATKDRAVILRLTESASRDLGTRQHFLRDARALEKVDSPHVAVVLDVIDEPDVVALVVIRQQGETLASMLEQGRRLPLALVVDLGQQILSGLEALEGVGLRHGRLRPDQIFISAGVHDHLLHVTLVGVELPGVVHVAEAEATHRGTLVGMRKEDVEVAEQRDLYRAPEQGSSVAELQGDIYALGMVLLHALLGAIPEGLLFARGPRVRAALSSALMGLYEAKSAEAITECIMAMTATNLADRYRSFSAARAGLLELMEVCPREVMCPVPAGTFMRGSLPEDELAREEEIPQRMITLGGFYMDRTPVTVGQFKAYLDATGRQPVAEWADYNDPEGAPLHPVVYVTWEEACAYARWAGKALPTEAQWEKGARGIDGRMFPWGDSPPGSEHAWFGEQTVPYEVGSFVAGTSPYGLLDMAGNAFEWVQDWFGRDYYEHAPSRDPQGPEKGSKKVLRGGSFAHTGFTLRCATRGRYAPEQRRANHSFRCVWSVH